MRKFIVLDTETANSLDDPMVYDIGFAVVDEIGTVYEAHSYAIADVFFNKELMTSAYYAEKIPQYWEEIERGEREIKTLKSVKKILTEVMRKHHTNIVCCHNASFDYRALQTTQRYNTKSKYRYFLPYGVEIWDTLKMSRMALGYSIKYKEFCEEHGYMTNHAKPRVRLTAEIIYRFLTNDTEFVEEHKGLADVMIEKEILKYCLAEGVFDGRLWED